MLRVAPCARRSDATDARLLGSSLAGVPEISVVAGDASTLAGLRPARRLESENRALRGELVRLTATWGASTPVRGDAVHASGR
jgi:hypothetical protein